MTGWVELWYSLKPTTVCIGSGSIWVGFRYRSLSDVVTGFRLPVWSNCIYWTWVCVGRANLFRWVGFLEL